MWKRDVWLLWCQSCICIKIWPSENWQADSESVLGLTTNKRHRLQQSNTLHLTVKTTLLTIHTATAPRILLTLKNTSYNISIPDVKCVVIIARNVWQTPNRIQIAPVELFSVLKVNQLGHFMLTSLFWLSQLWDFSKSTDWSVCEFVVMIIIRNIKAEINSPKKWKRIFLTEHTLPFGHMTNVDRHSFYLLLMEKSAGDLKMCCNILIFSSIWHPDAHALFNLGI